MKLAAGVGLGKRLCELAGIDPKKVMALSIVAAVDSMVEVRVSLLADHQAVDAIELELRRFNLVEIEDEEASS